MMIRFNFPYQVGTEVAYIQDVLEKGRLSGDGQYSKLCHQWLEQHTGCEKALLTHSCTAALEMAATLASIEPGDEIIMPSYTFVSTANAFVQKGGVPVFVDIRPDTLNIDETKIEEAITFKTKAIVPVHYAGVACEMDIIMDIAQRHNLLVIEDAAQGIMASYKGRSLGTIGHLGTFSFHETKNIVSGEGGALLINDKSMVERAEVIWEKGTNRKQFFRNQVDKYTWIDVGSSYLPSEIVAAFLWGQLQVANEITSSRISIWNYYYKSLKRLENMGCLLLPDIPEGCCHNAHMFHIRCKGIDERTDLINFLHKKGIMAVFHYIPLHTSPAGLRYGRFHGKDEYTSQEASKLLRLPIYCGLSKRQQQEVIDAVKLFFRYSENKV